MATDDEAVIADFGVGWNHVVEDERVVEVVLPVKAFLEHGARLLAHGQRRALDLALRAANRRATN